MKVIIAGFELDVAPKHNPFGAEYEWFRVYKETEKAYCLEVPVSHRTFGTKIIYKWIAKSFCKLDENGDVFAPTWMVGKKATCC